LDITDDEDEDDDVELDRCCLECCCGVDDEEGGEEEEPLKFTEWIAAVASVVLLLGAEAPLPPTPPP